MPNKISLYSLLASALPDEQLSLPPEAHTTKISKICLDSRRAEPGCLFVAVQGHKADGRRFIYDAVEKGAAAVLIEDNSDRTEVYGQGTVVRVRDARRSAALTAKVLYGDPTSRLAAFGVTGTNGKTSVSWIITELLALAGLPAAQVGTLGARLVNYGAGAEPLPFVETGTTTPDAVWLQEFLASAEARGARAVSMEASSHGLVQHRTAGVEWDCVMFTNLTRDHLDFHGTPECYGQAKLRLFAEELARSKSGSKTAVLNILDPFANKIRDELRAQPDVRVLRFSDVPSAEADCCAEAVDGSRTGTRIKTRLFERSFVLDTQLVGSYNVGNLLCAVLACSTVLEPQQIAELVSKVPPVPGRLELAGPADISVFVDYAHTPDALLRAHGSLRQIAGSGRIITVFGCGGDRDRGKRPLMGRAVAESADFAVVTSDNPRSEEPDQIISDILPGIGAGSAVNFKYEVNSDRRAAIFRAVTAARPGDLVLIAGKGHEDYQEIKGVKHHFSDVEVAREALAAAGRLA